MVYVYDVYGAPVGMQYYVVTDSGLYEGYSYWFEKNLQGDVIAVYDEDGTKLIEYTYDTWGNHSAAYYNGGADSAAVYNPFRYRGYYYDEDLGLYYLQSRYYDSNTGRFISPDSLDYLGADGDLTSYNLYDYCGNNPVMYSDPSGHVIISAIVAGAFIGSVISFATSSFEQWLNDGGSWKNYNGWSAFYDACWGAVNGAFAASGIGLAWSVGLGAAFGGLSSVGEDLIFKEGEIDWGKAGISALIGGVSGLISGAGANNLKEGVQVTKYINSRDILQKTINNGTRHAVARQTNAMNRHISKLVLSGARYLGANAASFLAGNAFL